MKKSIWLFILCAISIVCNAQEYDVKLVKTGNLSINKAPNGCITTLHRSDQTYSFVVMGNSARHGTIGFELDSTPLKSIDILMDMILSYQEGSTVEIQGYTIECVKGKQYHVIGAHPDRELPADNDFWFGVKNLKSDIKLLKNIEKGKLSFRDRREIAKTKKELKKELRKLRQSVPQQTGTEDSQGR